MKQLLLSFSIALATTLFCGNDVFALKYTSITSGNFSSSATWLGGVIPPLNINTGDTILIETGHNVVLDQDITMSQTTAMLDVRGILRSSGSEQINFSGSSVLSVSGTLDIDSITLVNVTNAYITGQLKAKKMRCLIFSPSGAGNVLISEQLYVYGNLSNTGGNTISLLANGVIYMLGGQIVPSGTGIFTLPSVYDVVYSNSADMQPTGVEITGTGLRHVTVDLQSDTSELKLSTDLGVGAGLLTLTKGILSLNNHNLILGINGDLASSGTGKLKSTSSSDITVYTSGSLTGQLQFTSNGNTVHDLLISCGGTVKIGNALKVTGKVDFQKGKLDIQGYKLSLITGATVIGAGVNKYIITGTGGSLAADIGSGMSFIYDIGTAGEYAPCVIKSNNNTVYNSLSVGVNPGVKVFGTSGPDMAATQPMVNATWFVEHSNTTVDIDMEVLWSASMEVNGYNRGNTYISHLIGNYWDKPARKPALLNSLGLYSVKRTGITSLSPFAVFDNTTVGIPHTNNSDKIVNIYPNPAQQLIHIDVAHACSASLYNTTGQLVRRLQLNRGANSVDINNLQSGAYYLTTGAGERLRFIKQ